MLCRACALMFENIDQQMEEAKRYPSSYSNTTTFQDLLLAIKVGCRICSNIHNQLQEDNAFARSDIETPPLLVRSGWKDVQTGVVNADILWDHSKDDVPIGVKSWHYQLSCASQQDEHYGFNIDPTTSGGTHAEHRVYEAIPSSTRSSKALALARLWYDRCRSDHSQCRDTLPWRAAGTALSGGVRFGMTEPHGTSESRWYPPRLLHLSSNSIRLVGRRQLQQCPPFAALSHCWGQVPFLMLSTDNIRNFEREGVDYAALPENFRDAVDICRSLNISYLWIDSLCIIQQGCTSQEDWNANLWIMRYIYSSCDLCISTAATDGDTKSCFVDRDPATVEPVFVTAGGESHILIGMDHAVRGFLKTPIASRAWVLQERLLSRRVLTFGPEQMFWECCETEGRNVCESFPDGLPPYGYDRGPFVLPTQRDYRDPDPPTSETQRTWLKLVENYSECQLTKNHDDKLAAFGSIAQQMQGVLGGSNYIAGCFMCQLPAALLWHVRWKAKPKSRPKPPSGFYRSPSWSWAATDAPIRCTTTHLDATEAVPPKTTTYFANLLSYLTPPNHQEFAFARLSYAELTLSAPLTRLTWSGAFANTEQEQGDVCFAIDEIEYLGFDDTLYFDSQDDYNEDQEDVRFMPIHGIDHSKNDSPLKVVEGLIIRPAKRPDPRPEWIPDPFDPTQACYMRIGMARIQDIDLIVRIKALPVQEIVLL